jgi:hypothetical protein
MGKVKQISVFMENKPGTVGAVLKGFSKSGVNLKAMTVADTVDAAIVRMVVSDADKGVAILEEANMLCVVNDVLEVVLDDKPGAFEKVAQQLADAEINIHYAYGSAGEGGRASLYLRTSDTDKAAKLLGKKK